MPVDWSLSPLYSLYFWLWEVYLGFVWISPQRIPLKRNELIWLWGIPRFNIALKTNKKWRKKKNFLNYWGSLNCRALLKCISCQGTLTVRHGLDAKHICDTFRSRCSYLMVKWWTVMKRIVHVSRFCNLIYSNRTWLLTKKNTGEA